MAPTLHRFARKNLGEARTWTDDRGDGLAHIEAFPTAERDALVLTLEDGRFEVRAFDNAFTSLGIFTPPAGVGDEGFPPSACAWSTSKARALLTTEPLTVPAMPDISSETALGGLWLWSLKDGKTKQLSLPLPAEATSTNDDTFHGSAFDAEGLWLVVSTKRDEKAVLWLMRTDLDGAKVAATELLQLAVSELAEKGWSDIVLEPISAGRVLVAIGDAEGEHESAHLLVTAKADGALSSEPLPQPPEPLFRLIGRDGRGGALFALQSDEPQLARCDLSATPSWSMIEANLPPAVIYALGDTLMFAGEEESFALTLSTPPKPAARMTGVEDLEDWFEQTVSYMEENAVMGPWGTLLPVRIGEGGYALLDLSPTEKGTVGTLWTITEAAPAAKKSAPAQSQAGKGQPAGRNQKRLTSNLKRPRMR